MPSAYWCSLASKAGADPEELVLPLYKEAHHYAALEREDNQILDLDLLHHQNPYFVSRFRRYLQKPDNVVALATATPSEFRPSNLATSSLQDGVELMIKRGVEASECSSDSQARRASLTLSSLTGKAWDDLESKEFKTENEIVRSPTGSAALLLTNPPLQKLLADRAASPNFLPLALFSY